VVLEDGSCFALVGFSDFVISRVAVSSGACFTAGLAAVERAAAIAKVRVRSCPACVGAMDTDGSDETSIVGVCCSLAIGVFVSGVIEYGVGP